MKTKKPKRIPRQTKIKCKGWTSLWCDNTIGWNTSEYLAQRGKKVMCANPNLQLCKLGWDNPVFRCEITVRLIRDKRGRFITKTIQGQETGMKRRSAWKEGKCAECGKLGMVTTKQEICDRCRSKRQLLKPVKLASFDSIPSQPKKGYADRTYHGGYTE